MIRTGIFVFVAIFSFLLPSFVTAGELTPELSARIRGKAAGDKIPVWIKLPRVEDSSRLKASLKAAEPTRQGRHRAAMAQLKRNHAERQAGLLNSLRQMERRGQATGIRARWLANVIEAEVSAGQLEALANRADIELITTVPTLTLIRPDSTDQSLMTADSATPSLRVINADDAWAAGYTGAGRLVCSFDTGVDGDHPAFASRWKGLDGDSAAAWFDPRDQEPFPHPTEGTSHGTHVMGILTGRSETTDDTVGVAIDAQWMSAAVIDIAGAPILDAFEWAADPDGDPNSIDDVPDVINHSWGIEGADCQNIFYDMVDNLEALGIVNIFAAGNEGAASQTIRNPANRANDSLDCFAVGNVSTYVSPPVIASSSSRGPSDCNGAIKPNVCAPGTAIWSSVVGGLYTYNTGTSMAAPHVSGLVAMMRQKNPNATVDEIKTAILTTTNDYGYALPNNIYGWGVIDCMAALNALSPTNTVPNVKVYAYDHNPISPGTTVEGTLVLQNLGATAGNVTTTITGSNPSLTVLAGSASFGTIAEGDTVRSSDLIRVIVSDTVTEGTILSLDMQISGTGFSTDAKLFFVVEPLLERTQAVLDGNRIQFTVTNWGTYGLGPGTWFPAGGVGFVVDSSGVSNIYECGLMIGIGPTNISDGVRNASGEPDGDFAVAPGGNLEILAPGPKAAMEITARFIDTRAESPLNLLVEQHAYAFSEPEYDDFIIMRYVIKNTNAYPLNGVRVGLYFDWDVPSAGQYAQNAGGWNSADSVNWTAYRNYVSGLISTYRGVKVLDGTLISAYTADASAVCYYPDGFTEGEKFMSMASGITTGNTYTDDSNDLAQVTAVGPMYLPAGAVDTVAFAVIIGQTLPEFSEAAAMAQQAYDSKVADCCLGIRGNADGDPADAVNVSDLTFLVAVLFQGGDASPCLTEANVDGDGSDNINVSDLTYLVAVLFQGGADPLPCGEFAN